ncbi:MAG: non-ribosomal peptide synthetase, partial [Gammaproteobacteria bacterium]|nr:non-ribosomal peptide synthetase [Gammaproteobacteria bacterium]
AGRTPSLPLKTTSIQHWGQALHHYAQSKEVLASLPLWTELAKTSRNDQPLPVDAPQPGVNDWRSAATQSAMLGAEETQALMTNVTTNWRTQPHDLMLLALEQTLREWTGAPAFTVDVEAHGREAVSGELDLLRTIGWFTSIYPVRLAHGLPATHTPEQMVDSLRQLRDAQRQLPAGGIAFGVLRYLHDDARIRNELDQASPVLFNYLGIWRKQTTPGAMFGFAQPLMAVQRSNGIRPYQLEINAAVFAGRLRVDWTYSKNLHRDGTVAQMAQRFITHLRALIRYCTKHVDDKRSTLEFPTADLSQHDLDDLLDEFGEH